MTEEEIQALKEQDVQTYSKSWDVVKGKSLRRGMKFFDCACKGMVYSSASHDNFKELNDLKECYDVADQYKSMFLFDALDTILNESELHLGKELHWVREGFYELTQSKTDKALQRYGIGLFIHKLNVHGASKNTAIDEFSKWTLMSETKCRDAYFEFQKIRKLYPKYLSYRFWNYRIKEIIKKVDKPFPSDNPQVFRAYNSLVEELENYEVKREKGLEAAKREIAKLLQER